ELKKQGGPEIFVTPGSQAKTQVAVGLSESLRDFLWIARIQRGTDVQFVFSLVPRATVLGVVPTPPRIGLQEQFLLSSAVPILDAFEIAPGRLVVLQPERVAL